MSEIRPIQEDPVPSDEVRAKAAEWVAQLHDEQRSPDVDAGVRAWLSESEHHRRAFDRMTRAWELAGKNQMRALGDGSTIRKGRRSRFIPWAAAIAATLVLAVVAAAYLWRDN